MYDWLCRHLPPRLAGVLVSLWYTVLILLIFLLWRSDEVFRYGRL